MKQKHICHNCGATYDYCRGCLITPILYKELGFCSEKCHEEFKNKPKEVVQMDVEVVVNNNEDTTIS